MFPLIMENQMEKNMENYMETGIILVLYWTNIGLLSREIPRLQV